MKIPEVSQIPCCKCKGAVIEFSVDNDIWNQVVRHGGCEHDMEYLCVQCFAEACVVFVKRFANSICTEEDDYNRATQALIDFDPSWE